MEDINELQIYRLAKIMTNVEFYAYLKTTKLSLNKCKNVIKKFNLFQKSESNTLRGGGKYVTSNDFEYNVKAVCGTWTFEDFKEYLDTTNFSKQERKEAIKNFKEGEEMLRDFCKKECYGCSYDLLQCMSASSCESMVEQHNLRLRGGRKNIEKIDEEIEKQIEKVAFEEPLKEKKKKLHWIGKKCPICQQKFKKVAKKNLRESGEEVIKAHPNLQDGDPNQCYFHYQCLWEGWLKDKPDNERFCPLCQKPSSYNPDKTKINPPGIVKKISSLYDCPQYNDEKKCVEDFNYKKPSEKLGCVAENDLIGVGKYELSDQQCYSKKKLNEWVKNGNNVSPVTKRNFSNDDLQIIKGKMLEQEQTCILSMVHNVLGRFLNSIGEWQTNTLNKEKMTSSSLKSKAAGAAVGAASGAYAGFGGYLAALGLGAAGGFVLGIVAGTIAATSWLREKIVKGAIDLGVWIIKDPKTAMMFMMVVKMTIKAMCKEMAKLLQRATYERKTKLGLAADTAKGYMNTFMEGGEISVGTILRGACNGETWKKVWKNGGDFASTCVASVIPGGPILKGVASGIVGGLVGAAEEATKTGIELAAYQKDIKKGTELVMDILTMLLNPEKCMQEHGIVKYTSCGQLQFDKRACLGAPECRFIPQQGTQTQECIEIPCDERRTEEECEQGNTCVFKANKCKDNTSWF